mgnify:CR=1 FL=1
MDVFSYCPFHRKRGLRININISVTQNFLSFILHPERPYVRVNMSASCFQKKSHIVGAFSLFQFSRFLSANRFNRSNRAGNSFSDDRARAPTAAGRQELVSGCGR